MQYDYGLLVGYHGMLVHHIKPTQGGYMEVKGFQDWSTYS